MIALVLILAVTGVFGEDHGYGHNHNHSCIHSNVQQLKEAQVVSMVVSDMDRDGDGTVTPADVRKEFVGRFDANSDGRIPEDEFVKQWHQFYHDSLDFAGYLFHHFDGNDDGELSDNDLAIVGKTIDKDGDNEMTKAEFTAYLTRLYTECVPSHGRPVFTG